MRVFTFLLFLTIILFGVEIPDKYCASFSETITSDDNKQLHYKGIMQYNKPLREIVWKYVYPENKIIWIKDKVYIYEPELMQVTISKRDKITLDEVLRKAKKVDRNLYKAVLKDKIIYFIFDEYLRKIYYTDTNGNNVVINFSAPVKCNEKLFNIDYPKDVDVIYQK